MIFTLQANIRTRYAIAHLYLCLFAGHQENGLVVRARSPQGSFHGNLFAHVHVFGTGLHAELRVPASPPAPAAFHRPRKAIPANPVLIPAMIFAPLATPHSLKLSSRTVLPRR